MTGYEAYQVFEHLRDTGTIQAFGEMLGQAFAKGLAAEAAKLDQEMVAAHQLADALVDLLSCIEGAIQVGEFNPRNGNTADNGIDEGEVLWERQFERARDALRAAGRLP